MEYVYMQQPMPSNVTGVPVTLSVLDANGNYRSIGTTTSDGSGMYSLTWTPDIAGDFTVVASFAGTESYYPSSAETSFHASEVTSTTTAPVETTQSAADLYFIPAVVGLFIAIIVVGLAIILLQRKHP
jgi:hypothetical protein